jgi:diaminopimelate decarboxylase
MSFFTYKNNTLHAENVSLATLAATIKTPFYCYAASAIKQAFRDYQQAFDGTNALVCYAMKANANPSIIKLLAQQGAGADVVSEGELRLALQCGIASQKIVFAGVGKTKQEIAFALTSNILQLNVESAEELESINAVAATLNKTARVALRVNPNVDAKTHAKITTGLSENKFGIAWDSIPDILRLSKTLTNIAVEGIAVHIGSQLTSLTPFEQAFTKVVALAKELIAEGYPLKRLDLGGGFGIAYNAEILPPLAEFGAMVKRVTHGVPLQLIFEPGRYLVGKAGVLVTSVIYVKQTRHKAFAVVDAGMNDFMRTALYEAEHQLLPLHQSHKPAQSYDVVGPVCESTDVFNRNISLPTLAEGDVIVMLDTGAYGTVLGSSYNMRLPAVEILVEGDKHAIIKRRPEYAELQRLYQDAPWLT